MNIDPWNTADFIETYDLLRQQQRASQQPGDISAQTSSPARQSADQGNFEQQLSDLRPIHQDPPAALTDAEIGSPPTVMDGNLKARAIQESERCPAPSFVRGAPNLPHRWPERTLRR